MDLKNENKGKFYIYFFLLILDKYNHHKIDINIK